MATFLDTHGHSKSRQINRDMQFLALLLLFKMWFQHWFYYVLLVDILICLLDMVDYKWHVMAFLYGGMAQTQIHFRMLEAVSVYGKTDHPVLSGAEPLMVAIFPMAIPGHIGQAGQVTGAKFYEKVNDLCLFHLAQKNIEKLIGEKFLLEIHYPFPIGTWKLWNGNREQQEALPRSLSSMECRCSWWQAQNPSATQSGANAGGFESCGSMGIDGTSQNNMKPHVNQICRQICLPLHVYIFIVCLYFICVRSIGLERGFFYVFVVTFVWNQKYSQNWMINTQNKHTKSEFSWPLAVSCISHIFTQWSRSSHGCPSLPHGHPR